MTGTQRATAKGLKRTEKIYSGMGRDAYGKGITRYLKSGITTSLDQGLANRQKQAKVERDYLSSPSAIDAAARELKKRSAPPPDISGGGHGIMKKRPPVR